MTHDEPEARWKEGKKWRRPHIPACWVLDLLLTKEWHCEQTQNFVLLSLTAFVATNLRGTAGSQSDRTADRADSLLRIRSDLLPLRLRLRMSFWRCRPE